jgi:hypothetical protein
MGILKRNTTYYHVKGMERRSTGLEFYSMELNRNIDASFYGNY